MEAWWQGLLGTQMQQQLLQLLHTAVAQAKAAGGHAPGERRATRDKYYGSTSGGDRARSCCGRDKELQS